MPGVGISEVTILLILCLFNLLPVLTIALVIALLYMIMRRVQRIEETLQRMTRDEESLDARG